MSAKLEVDVIAKVKDFANGLKEAGKQTETLGTKIDGANKKSTESTKALNTAIGGMKKGIDDALGSVVPFYGQLKTMGTSLGGVSAGMKGVSGASKILKTALISTGIGAIAVAFGSLIAYLTSTQAGMDKLRQFTEPVAQIFQRLLGVMQNLGGNVFKGIAQMLNGELKEGFKTLAAGAKQAGKEVVGSFKGGIEAGKTLADLTVQIEEAKNSLILTEGRLNREIAEQSELSMQLEKGEKVTQAAAKKAIELINKRTAAQNSLLDLEIKKMKLEQEANDTSRQGFGELNKLIAEREQNEANAARERRRLNAKANSGIVDDFKQTVKVIKKDSEEMLKSMDAMSAKIGKTRGFGGVTPTDVKDQVDPKRLQMIEGASAKILEMNKQIASTLPKITIPEDAAARLLAYGQAQNELALGARKIAENMNSAYMIGDLFGQGLTQLAETGKISFKGIIQGLIKLGIQLAAAVASALALNILTGGAAMAGGMAGGAKGLKGLFNIGKGMGLTPFANGGIVSGPTPAMVGEYTGARTNPEVIAPLSKLQNMMGGNVTFSISGDNLVGTLNRANKTRSRKF